VTAALSSSIALLATLLTLPLFRRMALRYRIVDRPTPRKIHMLPVPYLGGLAIAVGIGASLLLVHPQDWAVLVLLVFAAVIGLIDDIRYLPVWSKLLGEGILAATAVALGYSWHLSDSTAINAGVSIVWIVGLTNSFNLLDNMDGLAATVAACSMFAVAVLVPTLSPLPASVAGAALGFLFINRPRARMFMGDAGSLMLGFGIALSSIAAANTKTGLHSLVILAFPVAVAIFDTSLVIVSRLATGRPVQLGGQDHFSHRLRLLGWSQYQILAASTIACLAAWATTALALQFPLVSAWLALPMGLGLGAAWVALLRVDPYATSIYPQVEVYDA